MKIEKYKANGEIKYRFRAFLGRDPSTGKQIRVARSGFDTRREAELALLKIQTKKRPKISSATLEQIYYSWLSTYRMGVKPSTLAKTEDLFSLHILPVFGSEKVSDITAPDVQAFVSHEGNTVIGRRAFTFLKKILDFSRKQGYIDQNPAALVDLPRRPPKRERENFYTLDELHEFFRLAEEKLSPMWLAFFRVLAYTGMRRGEALALTWDDFDESSPSLSVSKTVAKGRGGHYISNTPKTSKSNRTILIDDGTAAMLQDLPRTSCFIFPNSKGSFITPSQPVRKIHLVVDGEKLKYISPHGFRHTHCSMLFSAGVPIPEVQDRLGHSDVKTTLDIYNHVYQGDRRDALDRFINFISATKVP